MAAFSTSPFVHVSSCLFLHTRNANCCMEEIREMALFKRMNPLAIINTATSHWCPLSNRIKPSQLISPCNCVVIYFVASRLVRCSPSWPCILHLISIMHGWCWDERLNYLTQSAISSLFPALSLAFVCPFRRSFVVCSCILLSVYVKSRLYIYLFW